ncbi:MAG: ABC transporter ATP-binding protein [Sulfuriflexus sp.]|nr:ABC transporter ATP-binding protein [Sulfuriflexus sp.]
MALISTQSLTVDERVKGLSVELHRGEVLGLIGPNGAGKSTFLHALVGLEKYTGKIESDGIDLIGFSRTQRARLIGLQPQTVSSAWPISVADVVTLGRLPWGDEDGDAIDHAMKLADINDFSDRRVDHLSGGERARVWLARVLAGQPQVLLADEPVANLDIHFQLSVMDVLKNYAAQDHGVIVALHDLSLAARYCDKLCLLKDGECVAIGSPAEVLTESLLHSVYGVEVDIDLNRSPPVVLPK